MSKKKYMKLAAGAVIVGIAGFFGLRALISLLSPRPDNLGVTDGQLPPCPPYPNCVSTQSDDERHQIAPIPYTTSTAEAQARIVAIVQGMPRATIITETPTYVYAEFVTPGFHYTDDVEFYFDEAAQRIHFRSSARVPYYDFQVNRERMEEIRAVFEGAP